jgi:hypothetical protein
MVFRDTFRIIGPVRIRARYVEGDDRQPQLRAFSYDEKVVATDSKYNQDPGLPHTWFTYGELTNMRTCFAIHTVHELNRWMDRVDGIIRRLNPMFLYLRTMVYPQMQNRLDM